MIDHTAFGREMALLSERFNRQVSKPVMARYFETLNASLSTEQFEAAARTIFDHDTFWPAPVRFLEIAGVDPSSEAEAAWELALAEASRGEAQPMSAYDPAHAAALTAVGKNRRIGQTNEDRLPFVKREFIAAYKAHKERAHLPALETPKAVALEGLS